MSDNIYEARQRVEDAEDHLKYRLRQAFPSVKLGLAGVFSGLAAVAPWDSVKIVFGTAAAGMTAWAVGGYYIRDAWGISDYRLVKMAKNILADAESDLRRLERENGERKTAGENSEFLKSLLP